jgi:hypothetical protein
MLRSEIVGVYEELLGRDCYEKIHQPVISSMVSVTPLPVPVNGYESVPPSSRTDCRRRFRVYLAHLAGQLTYKS